MGTAQQSPPTVNPANAKTKHLPYVVLSVNGTVVAQCCGAAWAAACVLQCQVKGATVWHNGKLAYTLEAPGDLSQHDDVWRKLSTATAKKGGVA